MIFPEICFENVRFLLPVVNTVVALRSQAFPPHNENFFISFYWYKHNRDSHLEPPWAARLSMKSSFGLFLVLCCSRELFLRFLQVPKRWTYVFYEILTNIIRWTTWFRFDEAYPFIVLLFKMSKIWEFLKSESEIWGTSRFLLPTKPCFLSFPGFKKVHLYFFWNDIK